MYEYIEINGVQIPRPPDFSVQREDVYAQEITTCTGKIIADRIGWKYSDTELSWEALCQEYVDTLVNMSGVNTLKFDDADGTEHTENAIVLSKVWMRHRYTWRGKTIWKDVRVEVRFINVHN